VKIPCDACITKAMCLNKSRICCKNLLEFILDKYRIQYNKHTTDGVLIKFVSNELILNIILWNKTDEISFLLHVISYGNEYTPLKTYVNNINIPIDEIIMI
jgi:hypothetical protein